MLHGFPLLWPSSDADLLYPVWCRRTDELVDGPNASHITPTALDRWEKRLNDLFEGRPFDMYDAALSDTVSKFPVDIQVSFNRFARVSCNYGNEM